MTDRLFREVVGPVLTLPGQDDVPKPYRQSAPHPLVNEEPEPPVEEDPDD